MTGLFPGLASFSRERLGTFWRYAKVEMRPPTPGEFPAVQKGFRDVMRSFKTKQYRDLTVKVTTVLYTYRHVHGVGVV